ncbi:MAG TPA: hypothetical protein VLA87_07925 [Gaiellaceae bacterium]|nr:hypothetical protein [Gaiellaceae bacterium]
MRGRFVGLVERQLELFETEHGDMLEDCRAALDAYNAASRDEAEELYGDYVDQVDAARDALLAYRYTYAYTLDDEAAAEYEEVFNSVARKRLPGLGLELS